MPQRRRPCGTIGGLSATTSAAASPGGPPAVACPGCGTVLAPQTDDERPEVACARLFDETLGGLREEALADPSAAAVVELADDAYAVQHPADEHPADPQRLADARARLAARFGAEASTDFPAGPPAWRTTIADVAADLDVIDLPALVESWARTVAEDSARSHL